MKNIFQIIEATVATEDEKERYIKYAKEHIAGVKEVMLEVVKRTNFLSEEQQSEILNRATVHDQSKLKEGIELDTYAKISKEYDGVEFGTKEYDEKVKKLGPAFKSHVQNNGHHVEHWPTGLNEMSDTYMIECCCDGCHHTYEDLINGDVTTAESLAKGLTYWFVRANDHYKVEPAARERYLRFHRVVLSVVIEMAIDKGVKVNKDKLLTCYSMLKEEK